MAVFAHLDGPETDDAVALRVQTMVDAEAYLASTVEGGEEGLASYRYVFLAGCGGSSRRADLSQTRNTTRSGPLSLGASNSALSTREFQAPQPTAALQRPRTQRTEPRSARRTLSSGAAGMRSVARQACLRT